MITGIKVFLEPYGSSSALNKVCWIVTLWNCPWQIHTRLHLYTPAVIAYNWMVRSSESERVPEPEPWSFPKGLEMSKQGVGESKRENKRKNFRPPTYLPVHTSNVAAQCWRTPCAAMCDNLSKLLFSLRHSNTYINALFCYWLAYGEWCNSTGFSISWYTSCIWTYSYDSVQVSALVSLKVKPLVLEEHF